MAQSSESSGNKTGKGGRQSKFKNFHGIRQNYDKASNCFSMDWSLHEEQEEMWREQTSLFDTRRLDVAMYESAFAPVMMGVVVVRLRKSSGARCYCAMLTGECTQCGSLAVVRGGEEDMAAGRRHGGPYYERFPTIASLREFAVIDTRMVRTGNGDGSSSSVVYLADTREVKRPTFRMADGGTCPCTRFAGQCAICGNLATWRAVDGLHETHRVRVPGYQGSSSEGFQYRGCTRSVGTSPGPYIPSMEGLVGAGHPSTVSPIKESRSIMVQTEGDEGWSCSFQRCAGRFNGRERRVDSDTDEDSWGNDEVDESQTTAGVLIRHLDSQKTYQAE